MSSHLYHINLRYSTTQTYVIQQLILPFTMGFFQIDLFHVKIGDKGVLFFF